MPLSSGTKLGQYEIVGAIGAGGMGEVYRARDTKLGRDVAVKVLAAEFSQDKERLGRFEREARLLAQLNHTNIATLHGLEDSGANPFLVMELVEGETLAERIAPGPLPIEEAIRLFEQIADGLEAAHAKGIIHRDLKPANIKVDSEGKVKILDFGLAKAFAAEETTAGDSSQSPTLTKGTALGAIMGTASYMSPEQSRGKSVDEQTDVWAFGCCLYEALTGAKAFEGETVTDVLAAVVHREPDWNRLPAATPSSLRRLLSRCLTKDAKRRLHHIGDARLELLDTTEAPTGAPTRSTRGWRELALGIGLLAVGALAAVLLRPSPVSPPSGPVRFEVTLPEDVPLAGGRSKVIAISPDGEKIVYRGQGEEGRPRLFLRRFGALEPEPMAATEGASDPFFSADGEWLVFDKGGSRQLSKINLGGGTPIAVTDIGIFRGGHWGTDDRIVLAPSLYTGLSIVDADGSRIEPITSLDVDAGEMSHRYPRLLPSGKAVIYTVSTTAIASWEEAWIMGENLETGERRVLVEGGSDARYAPTGHLVFAKGGQLFAVAFDPDTLRVAGAPVLVLDGVVQDTSGGLAQFDFSDNGTLVYLAGSLRATELVWVDHDGNVTPIAAPPRPYVQPRLSPDGRRFAVVVEGPRDEIWIYDLEIDAATRFTFEKNNHHAVWSPDGEDLAFESALILETREPTLYWKPADGSAPREALAGEGTDDWYWPSDWLPDGRGILFETQGDIHLLSLEDRAVEPVVQSTFDEGAATIAPDGHLLAFVSNESGREEVYVQSFPGPSGKVLVSTAGGDSPLWSPDGRELFYRAGNQVMTVDIRTEPTLRPGRPRVLFEGDFIWGAFGGSEPNFDISPDGTRFLMVRRSDDIPTNTFHVVLNWFSELERLVPIDE